MGGEGVGGNISDKGADNTQSCILDCKILNFSLPKATLSSPQQTSIAAYTNNNNNNNNNSNKTAV